MKIVVVVPTYNEAENLQRLIHTILSLPLDISIFVVDDNSPDGTGEIAQKLVKEQPEKIEVSIRPKKMGLSSAYIVAFRKILETRKTDAIVQMDADFSHDPAVLVRMAQLLQSCDAVSGSRYVAGGSLDKHWSPWRKALSTFGNFYARMILRVPLKDLTTGFRMWRSSTLQQMPLGRIRSNGYSFQVEMIYIAYKLGFDIKEEPIYFSDRYAGKSKMDFKIQVEAALRTWDMPWRYRDLKNLKQKSS